MRFWCMATILLLTGWPAQAARDVGSEDGEPPVAASTAGDQLRLTRLTLSEAVAHALRHNPTLVNARLGRVLDRYDLEEALEWFRPQFSFGAVRAERYRDATGEASWDLSAGPNLNLRLPTGGSIALVPGWVATVNRDADTWREGAGVAVTLSQPLLRGGGLGPGRAPVKLARLAEERNALQFKAAVMDIVTAVIGAYRAVIEAKSEVEINQRSLERARETLEVNRLLVQTGRMARQDMTQTQANIADRELGVVESQIRLDDAHRVLNVLLDLDGGTRVVTAESPTVEPATVDVDESRELARLNHTAYLQALLNVRRNEIQLMLSRNQGLWDLSFNASANYTGSGEEAGKSFRDLGGAAGDYRVSLSLAIPVGGVESRRMRRQRLSAELAMRQAENSLASASREMEIAVRNAVRAVETGVRRFELAQSALKLASEKVELERGKLRLGLSSNFRLAEYQTDLLNAQVGELRAKIDYLNAVTAHDRTVGTVLDTWGIDVDRVVANVANQGETGAEAGELP